MKLLYTSDIHTSANLLSDLLAISAEHAVDTIIIGGDLIPRLLPTMDLSKELQSQKDYVIHTLLPAIKRFQQMNNNRIFLDLSNFDFYYPRRILEKQPEQLFSLLHMRKHHLTDTVDIIGYMSVPPTPFKKKDWEKPDALDFPYPKGNPILLEGVVSGNGKLEDTVIDPTSHDTIEADLTLLEIQIDKPFILVAHAPPYGTPLDVTLAGLHVGSISIRRFIEKWSRKGMLLASLHGHIHESPMISGSIYTFNENTVSINPGQNQGPQAKLRYVILTLEATGPASTPRVRIVSEPS